MEYTTGLVGATAVEVANRIHEQLAVIEDFTGHTYAKARQDILVSAVKAVTVLRSRTDGGDDQQTSLRDTAARTLTAALFGPDHPPAAFWHTALGADVAWAIGYTHEVIPVRVASAVLACSRQAVWDLLNRQQLTLTAGSVKAYIRQSPRWQHAVAPRFREDS